MTVLVTVVCAVCNSRIGDVVPTENGYALEDPDRIEPGLKQIHDFTVEPRVLTVCIECGTAVGWTLDDGDLGCPSLRELIAEAERSGEPQRHSVGRGSARKKRD